MSHYDKQREKDELDQRIRAVEQEIKRNIEENAALHKEKASLKRELWELNS